MRKILVITGVTATGKTELSIELARKINGEIISADSMMVYKYMDIGTAKPSIEDRKTIPHHVIDVVEPSSDFSVKDFLEYSEKSIKQIIDKGKVPVVVGGTWLYIQALLYGLTDAPEGDWKIREKLYSRCINELYDELKRVDRIYAEKIHKNDRRRIIRALEVYYISGKPFSYFIDKHRFNESRYDFVGFVLERDREEVMNRIEKRVDNMFRQGLIDEVKNLVDMGYENAITSKQAIGYKEVLPYLKGEISLEEAKESIIKNTRDFAKRQIRTFRSKFKDNKNWHRLNISNYTNSELLYKIIEKYKSEEEAH
ncbi:tRNA (adenosine(37)-N6)-dimethylallyltransferase MiaA [Persephonella sp.]